jgi:diguanylate cyclase (GGDEF)-like protein/PAS domain S-box-containing protein
MIMMRLILLPLLILAAGFGVTWTVWNHERQVTHDALLSQFNFALSDSVRRIEQRMASYEQMLRGVQGLFAATGTMDRDGFRDYVGALNFDANFSGIQTIGLIEWVGGAHKHSHIAHMHRLGFAGYSIRPDGRRDDYAPIIQREPNIGLNRGPLGFDAWSEPVRRLAMERARDSGMEAISGNVRLAVDADKARQPSFVMYLPIYARGQPHSTIAQRRAHLAGWVYASFRMRDVVASLYGEQVPGLAFAVYDGVEPSAAALLYQSPALLARRRPAIISANEYVIVAGHNWTLSVSALESFRQRFGRNGEAFIVVTGIGLSLLLALLSWLMVTSRSRAVRQATIMTSELRVAAVAFDSLEGMMVTDANAAILRVNSAFTKITGYTAQEVIGQTPRILKSDRHDAAFFREMWETIHRTGGWQGEIWDRRKNGEMYPKWLTISAVKGENGAVTNYVGAHHDITDRKNAEERIKELAFFDALTRLPNRTQLLDRLRKAIAFSARSDTCCALLFIDLDQFKTLNDTLGHDKGDLLLQNVAQRLATSIRENDTVARVGGDEFVVVLENLSETLQKAAAQAEAVGKKILAVLDRPYQLDEIEYRSTASIGATLFKGHQTPIDELLKQADLAMYKSKEMGRNALRFFDPAMQTIVVERAMLEAGLRKAIEGNQLLLHYQAQTADGNHVAGVEALVRWQHPQRGLVPPAEFIPLAEETGLILPLGNWVLETVCRQLALWAAWPEMAHLTVAVNVSAQQFREADFVAKLLAVIDQTGANPNRLKLELTESLLVDNVQDIIRKMHALKARGVFFALDDFGTGYSSLSYLKLLPLDQLKIDQSFVRDILIDPNDAAIATTIVALSRNLGLSVIAEGVESEVQRDFLRALGCHAYQGYHFCRPLPLAEFEAFAKKFR